MTFFSAVEDLPSSFDIKQIPNMAYPKSVLMCAPDFFDIVDVKNEFMASHVGSVNKPTAHLQWKKLKECFENLGLSVSLIPPEPGREDMVFCANQTFIGIDPRGAHLCVLSHMNHASRRLEVPAFARWFRSNGYSVEEIGDVSVPFEGSGDAVWHPGKKLVWGGIGARTKKEIYPELSKRFGVPVLGIEMVSKDFYHLDTCFSALSEKCALIYPPALSKKSVQLINHIFSQVIEANEEEALKGMACNAASFFGSEVVLQKGSNALCKKLEKAGFKVHEVETGEFMKSGGSVFCMKTYLLS